MVLFSFRMTMICCLALSFSVEDGFTILTGPNGSGKSNILEAMCM